MKWFREYIVTFKGVPEVSETQLTRVDTGENKVEARVGYLIEAMVDGIQSPVGSSGPEPVEYVKIYVDDDDVMTFFNVHARADRNPLPAYNKYISTEVRKVVGELFGNPLYVLFGRTPSEKARLAANALWFKPIKRITVTAKASGTVTQPVVVKLRVIEYSPETLRKILDGLSLTIREDVYDPRLGYGISVMKTIPNVVEEWGNLPGGVRQEDAIVMPFTRWSVNATKISVGVDYELSHDQKQVPSVYNDMKFVPEEDEAWIIKRIGVIPHENSQELWVKTPEGDIPDPHWRIEPEYNDLPFPGQDPDAKAPMRALTYPLIIAKYEHIFVTKTAKGSIPADGQYIVVTGKYIKGKKF